MVKVSREVRGGRGGSLHLWPSGPHPLLTAPRGDPASPGKPRVPLGVSFVLKLNSISTSKGEGRQPVFKKERNEVSQTEEDEPPYALAYVWNRKMRNTETTPHSAVVAGGRG